MARDAGTKTDKPSAGEGQGTAPKKGQDASDSAEALAQQESAEAAAGVAPKPKTRRKPAVKKAEGAAAETTGVDKQGAEAALAGAEAPGEEPDAVADEAPAEEKPKPKRARRKPAAKAAEKETDAAGEETSSAGEASAAPEAPAATPRARPRRGARRGDAAGVTVQATAKFVRSSPRKARLITDHIKGKTVDEARAILAYSPRSVAEDWRKLLESAIANAEHNHDLVGDDLRVLNATADDGPTLKRYQPRAMGRATRIRKRTSHLTITLTPKE